MGTGAIQSNTPSLLLSEELVSLAGSVGQEAPWQQQGQGTTLRQGALGLDRDASPQQKSVPSKPQSSPTVLLVLLGPLPSTGLILSPQRHCVALRRKAGEVGRQGHSLEWRASEGSETRAQAPPQPSLASGPGKMPKPHSLSSSSGRRAGVKAPCIGLGMPLRDRARAQGLVAVSPVMAGQEFLTLLPPDTLPLSTGWSWLLCGPGQVRGYAPQ